MTRIDRQIAWLIFALALALYVRTMAPGLLDGDAGEFQMAAWRFGLAHATGYPLYLLAGGAWQHLLALVGIAPSTALNAFSALTGATAVALLYVLMLGWLPGGDTPRRMGAVFSASLLAVNPTFWSQSLIAEVYALHALFVIAILWAFRHRRRVFLALLVGLSLTHHAMTLLLLPPLLTGLFLQERRWWQSGRRVAAMALTGLLPLLLYLYIPLRSGPDASPWYHQRLGDETLTLYTNTWPAFVDFVTGRSISVGFYSPAQALANLGNGWFLWRLHLTWIGLLLAAVGLYTFWRGRNWPVLAVTVGYVLLQQGFNLAYAIGDILVYYIPLYLMAAIWCGQGAHTIASSFRFESSTDSAADPAPSAALGVWIALACFVLPVNLGRDYYPRLNQSTANTAQQMWDAILAAPPPADAILVSNDRNELVPLFYMQAVEGRGHGFTGLFPLIRAGGDFVDIGATVETALRHAGDQPVLLIKPMPGLEIKFDLTPGPDPLVRVNGLAADWAPPTQLDARFGPLRLAGYAWRPAGEQAEVALRWEVIASLEDDYTTTVQIFDAQGEKLAQHDAPPGGVYYPTSHWKPGETLVERHTLTVPAGSTPVRLLVGMYAGPELTPLAPGLEIAIGG